MTVIPLHKESDRGTLVKIIRQAGLTRDDFLKLYYSKGKLNIILRVLKNCNDLIFQTNLSEKNKNINEKLIKIKKD